jgi:hypothetical protein
VVGRAGGGESAGQGEYGYLLAGEQFLAVFWLPAEGVVALYGFISYTGHKYYIGYTVNNCHIKLLGFSQ